MYDDNDVAAFVAGAHGQGMQVYAALGDADWPSFGCATDSRNWAFLIWGAEPLSGGFGPTEEQAAKDQVAAVAERYLAQDRAGRVFPDVRQLQWQLAVEVSWFGNGRIEKQLEV